MVSTRSRSRSRSKAEPSACNGQKAAPNSYEVGSWFSEKHKHGLGVCLRIDKLQHREKTEFQEFVLFESFKFGKTLVIDDVLQITEKDAPTYHEMYAHTAILALQEVRRVLVLGGGDGYMVAEVLKHPGVLVDWVDIDDKVRQACIDYFLPNKAALLRGPRVRNLTMDGTDHVKNQANWGFYDVVISDMQIPTDATERIYTRETHESMVKCLRPGGILVLQGSNVFIDSEKEGDVSHSMLTWLQSMVDRTEVCAVPVVGYVGGSTGILFGSIKDASGVVPSVKTPLRSPEGLDDLKVYTSDYHRAAFQLPRALTMALAAQDPGNQRRMAVLNYQACGDGDIAHVVECLTPSDLEARPTQAGYMGIFAKRSFTRGELVYEGESVLIPNRPGKIKVRTANSDYYFDVFTHCVWDEPADKRVFYAGIDLYMNHSCAPNSASFNHSGSARVQQSASVSGQTVTGRYYQVATRDIAAGEQLTCDYDLIEWDCVDKGIDPCKCGEAGCRGRALGFQYLSEDKQRRYIGEAAELWDKWRQCNPETLLCELSVPSKHVRVRVHQSRADLVAARAFAEGEAVCKSTSRLFDAETVKSIIVSCPHPDTVPSGAGAGPILPPVTLELALDTHSTSRGGSVREFNGISSFRAHSESPNTRLVYIDEMAWELYALRALQPGEQLTMFSGETEAVWGDGGHNIQWAAKASAGFTVRYRVADVEGKGNGLIATQPIKAGATVCDFRHPGCVKSFTEHELSAKLEKVRTVHGRAGCADLLGRMFCLSECPQWAFHHPGDAQYWNHAKNPNTMMLSNAEGPLRSIALRDISSGEELTESYTRYTDLDWYVRFCRADNVVMYQDGKWGQ